MPQGDGSIVRTEGRVRRGPPEVYCRLVVVGASGNENAKYSPEYAPPLTATMMYCLPSTMYVIGEPLC